MSPEILSSILGLSAIEQRVALRELFKQSLYFTAKYLLGYSLINRRTHGDIIRVLESEWRRKLIVMPRGSFKSSLCSVSYPIWLLLRDPNLRILLDSELYTNSKNFLREIKAHLQTPLIVELFGEFRNDSCWNEGEIIINQRSLIRKEASITASGVGAVKVGQHYDVILGDDYNSPSNSNTPEGLQKVIDHYRYTFSILEPEGTYALVGTRYAARDAIGNVLRTELEEAEGEGIKTG